LQVSPIDLRGSYAARGLLSLFRVDRSLLRLLAPVWAVAFVAGFVMMVAR
jgi:hypothetical protein